MGAKYHSERMQANIDDLDRRAAELREKAYDPKTPAHQREEFRRLSERLQQEAEDKEGQIRPTPPTSR